MSLWESAPKINRRSRVWHIYRPFTIDRKVKWAAINIQQSDCRAITMHCFKFNRNAETWRACMFSELKSFPGGGNHLWGLSARGAGAMTFGHIIDILLSVSSPTIECDARKRQCTKLRPQRQQSGANVLEDVRNCKQRPLAFTTKLSSTAAATLENSVWIGVVHTWPIHEHGRCKRTHLNCNITHGRTRQWNVTPTKRSLASCVYGWWCLGPKRTKRRRRLQCNESPRTHMYIYFHFSLFFLFFLFRLDFILRGHGTHFVCGCKPRRDKTINTRKLLTLDGSSTSADAIFSSSRIKTNWFNSRRTKCS